MQTRIDHKARTARYAFDSLGEFSGWIADTRPTWDLCSSQNNRARLEWDLNAGYAGALEMARNGWNDGAQRMQEALKAFPSRTPEPDTRTDVYGFRPHVPRFCAGAPDSMIRHTTVAETGAGRVLTLAVAINANAGTSAVCMSNFGVAVAQYINQLETDGTRVELMITQVNQFRSWRTCQAITLKHADQPLDLAVVAFAIGHPAMFRRLGFAAMERSAAPAQVGYGMAEGIKLSDLINPAPGIVILNGMGAANTYAPTAAKGLEYVSKQIETALKTQEL